MRKIDLVDVSRSDVTLGCANLIAEVRSGHTGFELKFSWTFHVERRPDHPSLRKRTKLKPVLFGMIEYEALAIESKSEISFVRDRPVESYIGKSKIGTVVFIRQIPKVDLAQFFEVFLCKKVSF